MASIERREPQVYVGRNERTPGDQIPAAVDRAFPALFGWLEEHRIERTGAPFIRYLAMEPEFELEFGVPVADAPAQARRELPAGRFAIDIHIGLTGLREAHIALAAWIESQGATIVGPSIECYLTDPADEPDPSRWEVEIAFPVG